MEQYRENRSGNGIDYLLKSEEYEYLLKNKRLGLITSSAALTLMYSSTIEELCDKYLVAALFSPEHGVRGNRNAGELVDGYTDEETGIYVHSLYRKDGKRLKKNMLKEIDVMIIDLPEVGARYYTFLYTMLYALEDCAKEGLPVVVLDRINPLGGSVVEGNCLKLEFQSFVGGYPLCMRYGLTIGEFAKMANEELELHADLTIVPCENLEREKLFPEYERPFIMPSLGIPRFESALLYPGMCLFEGTNISEGRGTSIPFEIVGAPFIRGRDLASAVKALALPGIALRPVYFTPTASKHCGVACQGIQILVTDRESVSSVTVGISILTTIRDMYPEQFEYLPPIKENGRPMIDLLSGEDRLRTEGRNAKEILEEYNKESKEFMERKKKFHIYA